MTLARLGVPHTAPIILHIPSLGRVLMNDLIQAVAKSPEILKEIYGDLAKPGVQQVGKALSTIIGLGNTVLWPLALLNERSRLTLEKNLDQYRKKLETVPEQQICEVPPEVGVPVAEKLMYVTNEELREMYVELLAKASQTPQANLAHPSFVNIISNLSPDEAILLKSIRSMTGIPFIEVRLTKGANLNEFKTLDTIRPGVSCLGELQFPQNIASYVSNLDGMGVLKVRLDIFMVGANIYEPLEANARVVFSPMVTPDSGSQFAFQRGKIEITPFGRLLLSACFPHAND